MPHQFINPNFHPLLVHYPLALLMAGILIEVFSFLGWRTSTFRAAGRWMILLGALSTVPVAFSGIYALSDVAHIGVPESDAEAPWRQVAAESPLVTNTVAWSMMLRHALFVSIASATVLLVVVTWIASSDLWRDRLHWPLLLVLACGVGLTGVGSYFSGEAEFTHGVGVRLASTTAPTLAAPTLAAPSLAGPTTENTDPRNVRQKTDYYVQPEQAHVINAGIAVALALVSIGLSVRAMNSYPALPVVDPMGNLLGEQTQEPTSTPGILAITDFRPTVPAPRFWLLAFLFALLTAVGGWYLLANGADASMLAFKDLWELIRNAAQNNGSALTRRLAHVICGTAIIVLPLLLAAFAQWAPRNRLLLSICALLLLVAIAGQVCLGVLLVFDGNAGPVTGYSAIAK